MLSRRFGALSDANGILSGITEGVKNFRDARQQDFENRRQTALLRHQGLLENQETGEFEETPGYKQRLADETQEKQLKTFTDLYGKAVEGRGKGYSSPLIEKMLGQYQSKLGVGGGNQGLLVPGAQQGGLSPDTGEMVDTPPAQGLIPQSPETGSNELFVKDPSFKTPEQRQIESEERKHRWTLEHDSEVERKKIEAEARAPKQNQSQAALYAKRIEDTEKVFKGLSDSGFNRADLKQTGLLGSVINTPVIGNVARMGANPKVIQQDQAERNFVNAVLRRESGASISTGEFDSAEKQYFPRPGDDDKTLAQKARNRAVEHAGIKAEAGPAYEKVNQEIQASLPQTRNVGGKTWILNPKTGKYRAQ